MIKDMVDAAYAAANPTTMKLFVLVVEDGMVDYGKEVTAEEAQDVFKEIRCNYGAKLVSPTYAVSKEEKVEVLLVSS